MKGNSIFVSTKICVDRRTRIYNQSNDSCLEISRDSCRTKFSKYFSYADLNLMTIESLFSRIRTSLRDSGLFDGNYLVEPDYTASFISGNLHEARIKCGSDHFSNREAVTFNRDGLITIAEWADYEAAQPIIKAFYEWLECLIWARRLDSAPVNTDYNALGLGGAA